MNSTTTFCTYYIFRTYGRPLVLRALNGKVNGCINTSSDRNFRAIDPATLHFNAPGANQDYYDALITGETCHGSADVVIPACGGRFLTWPEQTA